MSISFLSTNQKTAKIIALGAGQLRGDYRLGTVVGVDHLMFNDSSGAKWICNSYELHLKILLFFFFNFFPCVKLR